MSTFAQVFLKSGREASLQRRHLWVFSGAIQRIEGSPQDGDVVELRAAGGQYLATGHYQRGSIAVRVFSFEESAADLSFWKDKLARAIRLRESLGYFDNPACTAFRLVHGEGDGLPGLIADWYDGVAVLQCHDTGMYRQLPLLQQALQELLQGRIRAIFDKSKSTLNLKEFPEAANGFLFGESDSVVIREHDYRFEVDFQTGQKTGFFVDQRANRQLLGQYSRGRKVLNTFAYTGGFSVCALGGGAALVHSVEISEKTSVLIGRNVALNFGEDARHTTIVADALKYLDQMQAGQYDLIVLDPPAFAKHMDALPNALKGYRRINQRALEKLPPGGILFTFSCSQVVDKTAFRESVLTAALYAKRNVRILQQLCQPPDHPINICHPEGEYLKGLVLAVE